MGWKPKHLVLWRAKTSLDNVIRLVSGLLEAAETHNFHLQHNVFFDVFPPSPPPESLLLTTGFVSVWFCQAASVCLLHMSPRPDLPQPLRATMFRQTGRDRDTLTVEENDAEISAISSSITNPDVCLRGFKGRIVNPRGLNRRWTQNIVTFRFFWKGSWLMQHYTLNSRRALSDVFTQETQDR